MHMSNINKKKGKQTVFLENPVQIIAAASTVGPKESEGPLGDKFDVKLTDELLDEKSWEKAESKMVEDTLNLAITKAGLSKESIDYILAGDLLNQSIGATFGVRDLGRPFLGLFGACSTFGEAIAIGSMLIDGDFAEYVLSSASSHFCAAERQFRFPLELGTQRPLTSSWTVTGCGAAVLGKDSGAKDAVLVKAVTIGKIVDLGITDVNNMGAAMAPAAADTILAHFRDTNSKPSDYDIIISGDLGHIGKQLVVEIVKNEGYDLSGNYTDCGIEIFDREKQDTHAGGSGCGCSATVFSGHFYEKLKNGTIKRILFMPTGALLSPTSAQQGESIPGIAHAVVIERKA